MAQIEGMDRMLKNFREVNFKIPNIESRFLTTIGEEALHMLRINTPVDTGLLRESWILSKSQKEVIISNDIDYLDEILYGSIRHIPHNFVKIVSNTIDLIVLQVLQEALADNHRWFKLKGGKGRRFQQVGRTSAGFKGGVSFAGRATMVRAGTGRRQLKRRLSLRRRRGSSVNPSRKDVKLG